MPTYVYDCVNCGRFEQRQSITEPALGRCPQCGGVVSRVITGGSGFIIKGGGGSHTSPDRCDRSEPCCGRSTPCDEPPCGE